MPSKNPRLRIRTSTARDRGSFKKLVTALLQENRELGSYVTPSEDNIENTCKRFDDFVSGTEPGIVLMIGQEACLMAGPGHEVLVDHDLGRSAVVWGIYVSPRLRRRGASQKLYEKAFSIFREQGFDNCVGTIQFSNTANLEAVQKAGCQLKEVTVVKNLREETP